MKPLILVIEDNQATRKLFRVTLESEGYEVAEAADGRTALEQMAARCPDLVIEDLLLPDMDCYELAARLREQPGGDAVPILACSGYLSRMEEARSRAVGFSGYLLKPVEPAQLVQTVRSYLPRAQPVDEQTGRGRTILIAEDDPIQCRLLEIHLRAHGFQVRAAADGMAALEEAQRCAPDAVIADVLMPRLDGFDLCRRIREDPRLARTPVVLVSAYFVEEEDRRLGEAVGASAFIARTPDPQALFDALHLALAGPPPRPSAPPQTIAEEHTRRVARQLEREVAVRQGLLQVSAQQAAQLAVLGGVSEVLIRSTEIEAVLDEILHRYLDSSSAFSAGAVYDLKPDGGLVLRAQRGFALDAPLADLFGHGALVRQAIEEGILVQVPSSRVPRAAATELLRSVGSQSMVIAPLRYSDERLGALVTVSGGQDLDDELVPFIRAVAGQISLGVALTRALGRRAAAEQRYRELVEGLDAAVWEADGARRRYTYVSRRAERILGFPVERWLAEDNFWIEHVYAPDRDRVLAEYHEILARRRIPDLEFRAVAADGHLVWIRERVESLRSGDRETRVRGISIDVTELKMLEEQLQHAQQMEAVGRLASGVAHDFNNLLTFVLGRCDMILMRLQPGEPLSDEVGDVRAAAERATSLTRQLLTFSRREVSAPARVNLNRVVGDTERILQHVIGKDIELVTVLEPFLDCVMADSRRLEQILLNLALNARDAMPRGGELRIETRNVLVEGDGSDDVRARAEPHVKLSVADTGCGMDARTRERIFEPFFTTKSRGTGLGLSTAYGYVKQVGGTLEVRSEPGKGSVFEILLPSAGPAAGVEAPIAGPLEMPGGGETVLLVEDEQDLRRLVRQVLEMLGYCVLEARDGVEALRLAGVYRERIDVLVTDLVLPGMDGVELAEQLAAMRPGMKVLFTSGHPNALGRGAGHAFLSKPFTPREIAEKLRETLEEREAHPQH